MMLALMFLDHSLQSAGLRKPVKNHCAHPASWQDCRAQVAGNGVGVKGKICYVTGGSVISSSNVQVPVLSTTTSDSVCLAVQNGLLDFFPRAHTPGLRTWGLSQGKMMVWSACFIDVVVLIVYIFCIQVFPLFFHPSLHCTLPSSFFSFSF